jgi:hypothetical protein
MSTQLPESKADVGREYLPNRRRSELVGFELQSLRYVGTIGKYEDGRLAEVFLDSEKISSTAAVIASDLAVCASLALQYGCPAETLRHALSRDEGGRPGTALCALLDLVIGECCP